MFICLDNSVIFLFLLSDCNLLVGSFLESTCERIVAVTAYSSKIIEVYGPYHCSSKTVTVYIISLQYTTVYGTLLMSNFESISVNSAMCLYAVLYIIMCCAAAFSIIYMHYEFPVRCRYASSSPSQIDQFYVLGRQISPKNKTKSLQLFTSK